MRVLDLQHGGGIEHVLRGGSEVYVFAEFGLAQLLHCFQRRHQRMLDAADFGGDRFDVDVLGFGFRRDLVGGLRNDAELGLLERERGFEVVPFLHAVAVVEDRPEFVAAPQVLDQCVVEYAGCHWTSTPGIN